MTHLQGFLTQLSVSSLAALNPALFPQPSLYEGQNKDGPLWLTQCADQFFLSGDGRNFHQLHVAQCFTPPLGQGLLPYSVSLTLTPRLGGIALLHDHSSRRLLFNHPEQDGRLMRIPLVLSQAPRMILREAAFYMFSGVDTPSLEGALGRWWQGYTQPDLLERPDVPFATLTHVTGRVAHAVNNAHCAIGSHGPLAEQALGALSVFLEALSESSEARNAVASALRLHPRASEIEDMLQDIRDQTPIPEAKTADPVTLLKLSIADTKDIVEAMTVSVPRVTAFLRTVTERLPQDVPSGVATAETILKEAEEEFHASGRADAVIAPLTVVSNAREEVTVPVLYVEDDLDTGEMTMDVLVREGFSNLTLARSVQEALSLFVARNDITVVLSDFNLGVENGLEMARRMRQLRPQTRVLFVSGNDDVLKSQMLESEREEFTVIPKPYDIDDLGSRLREIAAAG